MIEVIDNIKPTFKNNVEILFLSYLAFYLYKNSKNLK